MVEDNEYIGDPSYITQTAKLTNAVSAEDVMRVYNKYIKGKNYVMTSVVPKDNLELAVVDAEKATVWIEEVKKDVANEEVSQGAEAVYNKTPSKHDRSEPAYGKLPMFKSPTVWTDTLDNGLIIYGIENNEVPLVQFDITIPGGHLLDPINKSGVSNLLGNLMMEGTVNKTSADLEEAIGLLGANINTYSTFEDFHITGSCLAKNFDETMALVKEIILEPRWDEREYNRLKDALETSLKGREANPNSIASMVYNRLLYGENHIFSVPSSGTPESTKGITIEDLKAYYYNLSPEKATFHIVGALDKAAIKSTLASLNNWNTKSTAIPEFELPEIIAKNQLYFIDFPGAKQSVLLIGKLALSQENDEANNLSFANEILGGGSSGKLFQTLRIGKGYTYGAYSSIVSNKEVSPFTVRTSVRANATFKSLEIIKNMVVNYANDFTEAEVELTKNKILKGNTRAFESLGAQLGMLRKISKYKLSKTFTEDDQKELINMTLEEYKKIINKYLNEEDMIYVIVGDKSTQFEEVKKLEKTIIELDTYGNKL